MPVVISGDPHIWEPKVNKKAEETELAFSQLPSDWSDPAALAPILNLDVDCYRALAFAVDQAMRFGGILLEVGDLVEDALRRGISTELERIDKIVAGLSAFLALEGNHEHTGIGQSGRHTPWYRFVRHSSGIGRVPSDGPSVFQLAGWNCAGIDYEPDREAFLAQWDKLPQGLDVVFIHQGSEMQIPFKGAWEICEQDIDRKEVKLVIAGHIHHPARYVTAGGNTFVSTGALALKPGDVVYTATNTPGISRCLIQPSLWVLGDRSDLQPIPAVTDLPIPSREYWLIDLTKASSVDVDAFVGYAGALTTPYDVKVVYDPSIASDLEVQTRFGGVTIRVVTVEQAKEEVLRDFEDSEDLAALLLQVAGNKEAHPAFELVLAIAQLAVGNDYLIQQMIEDAVAKVGQEEAGLSAGTTTTMITTTQAGE